MATQATLDKAAALRAQRESANSQLQALKSITSPTTEQRGEIRKLTNQISQIEYQFRTDKDLIALAGENMSPSDKLLLTGLATGTVGGPGGSAASAALIGTAAAVAGAEVVTGTGRAEPDTSARASDAVPGTSRQLSLSDTILPNILHQYPSYTYGISLHLLSFEEYNNIVAKQEYTPKRVLIASAGRYDASVFPRSRFFNEDFYFEDLEIETVIGLNAVTRNTNAIKISFTVLEPYGLTLMDRLISATNEELKSVNYLENVYLLEIDFFAQNDAGEIVGKLADITKRIPIKIAKLGIKAGVKGSEYAIEAFPFNHTAFDSTTVSGPDHIEIVSGKIEDFFASDPAVPSETKDTSREVNSPFSTSQGVTPLPSILQSQLNAQKSATASTFKSYAGALNSFYRDLQTKNLIGIADQYSFVFDPEILANGGGKFSAITSNLAGHKTNKMSDTTNTFSIRLANVPGQKSSDDFDPTTKIFTINAGTTVEKVINYVMRMSDYIQRQLVTPEDYGSSPEAYLQRLRENQNKPLNWFKIVPVVRIGEWDDRRKVWQRHITYHIQPYIVKNVKLDTAPQQTADRPVKKYEYLYSGKNNDIIDWDLQFNALYYNAMTVYKSKLSSIDGMSDSVVEARDSAPDSYRGSVKDPTAVMPIVTKPIIINTQTTAGAGKPLPAEKTASDLEESLYTLSDADMLQVNLKILGDPAYIKQDDVFYPPMKFSSVLEPDPGVDVRLTPNGSIRTDFSELYVQVMFTTPEDIDETTGGIRFKDKKQVSVFSGLYKVLTVTSRFSQGVFTQMLKLIRLPNQTEYDYTKPKVVAGNERVETSPAADTTNVVTADPTVVAPAAADPEDGTKAETVQTESGIAVDPEQKNLANVNATAPTETITTATAPQAVVPNPNAGRIKDLQSDLDRANASLSQQQFNVDNQKNLISIAEQNLARAQATNNASEITTWQNSIAERTRTLATLQNQFNDAKSKVDSINSQIAALQ